MYRKIVDLHVHSDNSYDGNHSAAFICETAELKEMRAICFTDHCEIDWCAKDSKYEKSAFQAFFEVAKAKSAFCGQILVLNGIEIGQPSYYPEIADRIINAYKYDQVLGSIHNLRSGIDPYDVDSFTKEYATEMFDEYLGEIIGMLQWGNFDVLAHLTYPCRYFWQKSGIMLDLNDFKTKIDEILTLTAKSDKALEINTSGLRQPIKRLLPEVDVVKRFKELGGKYITVGSDAHFAVELALNIEDGYDAAIAAGFDSITFFQDRTPISMKIE